MWEGRLIRGLGGFSLALGLENRLLTPYSETTKVGYLIITISHTLDADGE